MSEIEKLYENAGVKPTKNWQSCLNCKLNKDFAECLADFVNCLRPNRRRKATSERNFGMSNKYIIRNCPICEHCDWDNGYGELEEGYICKRITIDSFECKDIENCLLKRIVGLCKDVENIENVETLYDAAQSGIFLQANRILKLLDIQEVE